MRYIIGGSYMLFKSGFAWIKYKGYSYICKILEHNQDDSLFTVEIGDVIFTDVPVSELCSVHGDE